MTTDPMLPRSRVLPGAIVGEAVAALFTRTGRTLLTMLGTVLGLGSFLVTLGLTATAAGQISKEFSILAATQVTITSSVGKLTPSMPFPADSDARLARINGVTSGGVYWQVPARDDTLTTANPGQHDGIALAVMAASPGALTAAKVTIDAGLAYDSFAERTRAKVALLPEPIARSLGITTLADGPAIFVGDDAYTVVGTISSSARIPALMLSVVIPSSTALARYPLPSIDQPAKGIVDTRIGAATVVAEQVGRALRPDNPTLLAGTAPPDPHTLKQAVGVKINSLMLLLAGIALVIGAVGIANTTLVAVLERTAEIGLRRALGARPRHIAAQFLTEAGLTGFIGGLVAMSLGVLTILTVSIICQWTPVLAGWYVYTVPFAGAIIGILAGLYPALRATRIEPAAAIRS